MTQSFPLSYEVSFRGVSHTIANYALNEKSSGHPRKKDLMMKCQEDEIKWGKKEIHNL